MSNKEQKQFARRFSYEDWMKLCCNVELLDALDTKTAEECEVIAWDLLTKEAK